jgi:stage V sporulation protein D (sporulation-specific penicillin-binding protein)
MKPQQLSEETYNNLTSEEKLTVWSEMWKNPIVAEVYEPGSIFKAVTAAAGLEENVVDLYSTFNEHSGYVNVHGTKIKCWVYPDSHGQETFVEALENSCNPVFVKVGQRITSDKFHDYMINLGLNSKPDIMMSGVSNSLIPSKENIGPVELATMSFGHGISVTPLQMITALNGLINNGNLMEPSIIDKITTVNDEVVYKQNKTAVKQVVSEKTSKELRLMLESVVNNGSGRNAYIPGIRVGGKTGTSEKLIDGQYSANKVYSSFFGFAPVDDPEIAVLVIADEPKDIHYGSIVAAPAAKEILESTLKYRGIKPNFTN